MYKIYAVLLVYAFHTYTCVFIDADMCICITILVFCKDFLYYVFVIIVGSLRNVCHEKYANILMNENVFFE